jgi:hypothetical protein
MSGDLPTIAPQPSEEGQPGLHVKMFGWQRSDELEAVALRLIRKHARLVWLYESGYSIAYLLDHADPPEKAHDVVKVGLVSGWQRALTDEDAALIVNAPVWQNLPEQQREALVLHGLLHFGANEKTGKLLTVPHDVEEFTFVVAEYGAWRPSLRAMGEQLALGLRDGG